MRFSERDRFGSSVVFLPISKPSLNFVGALLLSINERDQIEVEKVKLMSFFKMNDEQEFASILYFYINEIIFNWIYFVNQSGYCD